MSSIKKHLTHLETVGLIKLAQTHPELEFMFRHALVQEAAYNSLLIEDRKKLHRQVGEAIEQIYPDQLEEFAAVLGNHFEIAGDEQRALKYFILAGDVSLRIYASTEAVAHYTRALEVAKRSESDIEQLTHLYTQRGRALELKAKYDQALDNYQEMESLAQQRDDKSMELASLTARATIHAIPNPEYHPPHAQMLLEQALTLAHELKNQAAEAKILWTLMLLCMFTGEKLELGVSYGEDALALVRQLNLREQLAFTLNDFGLILLGAGQLIRGQTVLEEADKLWRELGNLPMLADTLARASYAYLLLGDYDQSISHADEGFHISQMSSSIWGQANSRFAVGHAYLERGHTGQAFEVLQDVIALSDQIGHVTAQITARADLAWIYVILGASQPGFPLAHEARMIAEEQFPSLQSWPLATLARLHLLNGELAEAKVFIEESRHNLKPNSLLAYVLVPLAEGELALAKQEFEQVNVIMDKLIADLEQMNQRLFLSDAFYLMAKALAAQGQDEAACERLQEARTEAEAIGARRILWQILLALSKLETNPAEAEDLRQQAREIIEYITDHIDQDDLRQSFLNLPDVKAVLDD